MSDRWALSKRDFHLEIHAEVRYYEDCFSRMHCPFKPIRGAACCVELLKVASQIGFQGVMDMGMKYLAAAPWSDDEEKLVHAFRDSHWVPRGSLMELIARLHDSHLAEDEMLSKDSLYAKNFLSEYLQCVFDEIRKEIRLPSMRWAEQERPLPLCLQKFADAFHSVVSSAESGVCARVVEHALNLLKQGTLALLSNLKDAAECRCNGRIEKIQLIFWRLTLFFDIARKSNAVQTMVELLLDDVEVSSVLGSTQMAWNFWPKPKRPKTIYCIFQDVLDGNLCLDTPQRITLFNQWCWVLLGGIFEVDEVHAAVLISRFLKTLPGQKKVEIWMASKLSYDHGP